MKRRIFALATVLMLILAMTGCGKDLTASDYVKAELDAVKGNSGDSLIQEGVKDTEFDYTDTAIDGFISKLQEFDYQVIGEKDGGDTATVTVKITTYPFGEVYEKNFKEESKGIDAGNLGEADKTKLDNTILKDLANVKDKTYTQEVNIECHKDGGEWVGNFETVDFMNALFGGLITQIYK